MTYSRKCGLDVSDDDDDTLAVTVTEIITHTCREIARAHQGRGRAAGPMVRLHATLRVSHAYPSSPLFFQFPTRHDREKTGYYRQSLPLAATSTNDVTCQSARRANSGIFIQQTPSKLYNCYITIINSYITYI